MPSYSSNSAMRSGVDAQVAFMTEFTRRTYDAMRTLSELNLHFAQLLVQDAVAATRQVLACSDPLQMAATMANAAQPAAEHLRNYQQQLAGMLSGAQVELARQAESFMPQGSRYSAALSQSMAREDGDVTGGAPFTNASRANGTAADSTVQAHHHRS
jgi:phasin family protein